jgi:Domain of unknown function (DUF4158)
VVRRLSETQIVELFEPPVNQRELVRHYTLSEADLVAIRRCRGDNNRASCIGRTCGASCVIRKQHSSVYWDSIGGVRMLR